MEGPVQIRMAGRPDAALVADISRRTFYDSFAADNTKEDMDHFLDKQFSREQLMSEVGAPGRIFLLAFLDGAPMGYACIRDLAILPDGTDLTPPGLPEGSFIEIARIYAEQVAIGKGVGKALLQACLEIAVEKGREWVWLGVWEHNSRAIRFYTKWGFEKFGEHPFVLGSDRQTDWLMKVRVSGSKS